MMLGFSLCILCIKLYTCLFFFYCGIIGLLELDYKFKDLCIIQLILGWFFFSFCFNSFICIERNKKKKMIRTMFNFFFQVSWQHVSRLVGLEEFMVVTQTHNGYHFNVTVLVQHTQLRRNLNCDYTNSLKYKHKHG